MTTKPTATRLSLEAWQEREDRFRAIFAASPDYIYLVDLTGRIVDANPALLQRVGLSLKRMRQQAGGGPTPRCPRAGSHPGRAYTRNPSGRENAHRA